MPTIVKPPFGIKPPGERKWPLPHSPLSGLTYPQLLALSKDPTKWDAFLATLTPDQIHQVITELEAYQGNPVEQQSSAPWWEPVRWWDVFKSYTIGSFDDVKSWVLHAARDVGNLLEEDVHSIWHLGAGWSEDIVHWTEEVGNKAEGLIGSAFHDIDRFFKSVWHDAAHWFDDVRHEIAHVFDTVRHFVAHVLDEARHYVWEVLDKEVFHPLLTVWHWFARVDDWFWHAVNKAWGLFYHHFVHPLVHDIAEAFKRIDRLEHAVFHDIWYAIKLIEKCAEWLEWMAVHTFEDFFRLGEDLKSDVEKWIDQPSG